MITTEPRAVPLRLSVPAPPDNGGSPGRPSLSYDSGGSAVLHAMNGWPWLNDPTCPIDRVILWWISSTDWFDPHSASDHSGVWWCHRCERSFMGTDKGLTEVDIGWPYGARDAHVRQPQLAS